MSEQGQPGKVIHFRNVAPEITQEELVTTCQAFGPVAKAVMLKTKKQAMVQFADINSALSFMSHYSGVQLKISGRNVYCSYSKHQELLGETQNKILLVTFFNPLHKQLGETLLALISVDLVYQIFSPYGQIHKIVMMSKDAGIQALIQFTSIEGAQRAKSILSGYSFHAGAEFGTFTIDAQFSNLQELTVRQNTARARDYLTSGMQAAYGAMQMGNPYMQMPMGAAMDPFAMQQNMMGQAQMPQMAMGMPQMAMQPQPQPQQPQPQPAAAAVPPLMPHIPQTVPQPTPPVPQKVVLSVQQPPAAQPSAPQEKHSEPKEETKDEPKEEHHDQAKKEQEHEHEHEDETAQQPKEEEPQESTGLKRKAEEPSSPVSSKKQRKDDAN